MFQSIKKTNKSHLYEKKNHLNGDYHIASIRFNTNN